MIELDDRVGAVELARHLPPHLTQIQRLQFGDARFFGQGPEGPIPVGIERKRIGDLVSSMQDGRLSGHQLVGMLSRYQVVYLLVEGLWRADPKEGVLQVMRRGKWVPLNHGKRLYMARDVGNYLNTLAVMCGVIVWRSSRQESSAQWILSTYRWWQKAWRDHKSHYRFSMPLPNGMGVQLRKPHLTERLAKELPGVGWERARALGKRFKTPLDLLLADEKDLREVAGVGKVLARRIVDAIQGQGGGGRGKGKGKQ